MTARDRVDAAFGWLSYSVLRRPIATVVLTLIGVGLLATGLPSLRIETSFDSYLPIDNPAQRLYDEFRSEFGSGERAVILLRPRELFDREFLEELTELHDALEADLPYLDDLTSLVNARHLIGGERTLASEGLLDDPIREASDLDRLRDRLDSNPLHENAIVSRDRSATAILIEFDGSLVDSADSTGEKAALGGFETLEDSEIALPAPGAMLTTDQAEHLVEVLDRVLAAKAPASAEAFVAGTPLLAHRLGEMLTRDIFTFVAISAGLTALLLAALFRNFWATVYPLLVVGLSVVGTLGWMGLRGIPMTAVTEVLPSLLVTVGVGDAVHIQSMFYRAREFGADVPDAIRWATRHSGLAVLLTSLTTGVSMAAFQSAELQPIIDLGRAAPVGIFLALVLSTTLLPALMSLTPMEPAPGRAAGDPHSQRLDRLLLGLGGIGTRHPAMIVVGSVLILSVSIVGASRLRFSQDDLRWLPEDDSIRVATEELNRVMDGAEPMELYATAKEGLDLREPKVIAALRELEMRVSRVEVGEVRVAQSLSLVDVLEETHRALTVGSSDVPEPLPKTRPGISQELLLFESAAPDDLARLVDTAWSRTRIAVTVPFVDALYYPRFATRVAAIAEDVVEGAGLADSLVIRPTGILMVAGETFELLFISMARSYGIAFGVVVVLMLLLIGNRRVGLISAVPNLVPIVLVLGAMGWLGAPLDISSMLVGGILIGVVVDDTIHFAHHFARYREETGCSYRAIRETLVTAGRAMLVTSTVLSIGFFSFMGASLQNISDFGLYCGGGVILAFLADVVLLPALISKAAPCSPGCTCRHDTETWGSDRVAARL